MVVKKKEIIKNEDGQAIIEMVIFFPLLTLLFFYFLNVTASINGAINQQKITRSYFFARLKNNSMYPYAHDIRPSTWSYLGMSFIGWSEKFNSSDEPLLPCYTAKVPFFSTQETSCTAQYNGNFTNYIRVGTVFGMCGATYQMGGGGQYLRGIVKDPKDVASWEACTIQQ
jgi:hypothetical protein